MRKGFTVIELVVVVLMVGILAALSFPMYTDYVRRSKAAEVPTNLKTIAQQQIAFKEEMGDYATEIATLKWTTQNGTVIGKFYEFGTSDFSACDPGTHDAPVPIGLAEAWAIQPEESLEEWRSACMGIDLNVILATPF